MGFANQKNKANTNGLLDLEMTVEGINSKWSEGGAHEEIHQAKHDRLVMKNVEIDRTKSDSDEVREKPPVSEQGDEHVIPKFRSPSPIKPIQRSKTSEFHENIADLKHHRVNEL